MTESQTAEGAPIAVAIVVSDGRVLMVCRRINDGQLSWQFPAGEVKAAETGEEAAVRETNDEVGLTVAAVKTLGERIQPAVQRRMIYVACEVASGTAHITDEREFAEVEWCDRSTLERHVPHPLFEPIQDYLDASLR